MKSGNLHQSQQLASADSVCANIEEGYGRESTVEYRLSATIPKLAHL
jgi:four helix bundle protein